MEKESLSCFYERLTARRREILDAHNAPEQACQTLLGREAELTEMAQREQIAKGLAHLDTHEKLEVEAVDEALARPDRGILWSGNQSETA